MKGLAAREAPPPSVLHVELVASETSAPYNEHCLPRVGSRSLALCTYFDSSVEPPPELPMTGGGGTPLGFLRALDAAIRREQPDVIHTHTPHVGVFFLLLCLWRRGLRRRSVATIHNCYPNFRLRNKLMMLPIFAAFERVVCCSESSLESFPALYRWLAGKRLRAVQNGLDTERIDRVLDRESESAPAAGSEEHRFTVVSIGRLVPIKNPLATVRSFARAAEERSRLLWIGDGPLSEPVRREGAALRCGIELTGILPRDEVYRTLARADVFVSNSFGEGLPLAPLEAMACECPVILSDIPPHREFADGCDFVPLLSPDDVEGFAAELRRFAGMPATERQAIGRRSREWVTSRFNKERMLERYAAIYAEVANAG